MVRLKIQILNRINKLTHNGKENYAIVRKLQRDLRRAK